MLTFKIHQFHKAEAHRLGRFRLSVTTADGDIPLSLPESLAAATSTPKAERSEQQTKLLTDYVSATDVGIRKAKEAACRREKTGSTRREVGRNDRTPEEACRTDTRRSVGCTSAIRCRRKYEATAKHSAHCSRRFNVGVDQ